MAAGAAAARTVICVGDIHGYASKLRRLWANLEASIDPSSFAAAVVIFLGDYCDRGPDTRAVIDFLLALPDRYPRQRHVFLCGNHDLAFAAFVSALPPPPAPHEFAFADTWAEYAANEAREGWFDGEGHESMHVQGRRWGGLKTGFNAKKGMPYKGSIYDAEPTFLSYGVPHGSSGLIKVVPEEHKKFLHDLVWVHEEENVLVDTDQGRIPCKLIAVHAGLSRDCDVDEQLKLLRLRDTRLPKVDQLSGRQDVWDIPKDLSNKQVLVVSGHHGKLYIQGLRFVIDEGGGLENLPIAAVVFPSKIIIRDTDDIAAAAAAAASS